MQSAIIRGGIWERGRLMQLISQTATQEGASDPRVAVFGYVPWPGAGTRAPERGKCDLVARRL